MRTKYLISFCGFFFFLNNNIVLSMMITVDIILAFHLGYILFAEINTNNILSDVHLRIGISNI